MLLLLSKEDGENLGTNESMDIDARLLNINQVIPEIIVIKIPRLMRCSLYLAWAFVVIHDGMEGVDFVTTISGLGGFWVKQFQH